MCFGLCGVEWCGERGGREGEKCVCVCVCVVVVFVVLVVVVEFFRAKPRRSVMHNEFAKNASNSSHKPSRASPWLTSSQAHHLSDTFGVMSSRK